MSEHVLDYTDSNTNDTEQSLPLTLPEVPGSLLQEIGQTENQEFKAFYNKNRQHLESGGMADIDRMFDQNKTDGERRLGIWIDGTLAGFVITTEDKTKDSVVKIDYAIDKDYSRRGIVSAAVRTITEYENEQGNDVIAEVEPRNYPSIRLLTGLGFDEQPAVSEDIRLVFIHHSMSFDKLMERLQF